jgi:hypothetical protein
MYACVLLQGGAQGRVRTWTVLGTDNKKVIALNIKGNRWCENIGRAHKSNGIFYIGALPGLPYASEDACTAHMAMLHICSSILRRSEYGWTVTNELERLITIVRLLLSHPSTQIWSTPGQHKGIAPCCGSSTPLT